MEISKKSCTWGPGTKVLNVARCMTLSKMLDSLLPLSQLSMTALIHSVFVIH